MNFIYLLSVVIIIFGASVLWGAPYLPTLSKQAQTAINLLDLKPGHTIIDLGSGDGRILKKAAEQNIRSIGYEINPILFLISKIYTFRYRKIVTIYWANYWKKSLPKADGIFVFLIEKDMDKLDNYLKRYQYKPIKVVSFAFKIPKKQYEIRKNGIFLYTYK